MLAPPIASTGMFSSRSARSTPRCASPRAKPPPSASPTAVPVRNRATRAKSPATPSRTCRCRSSVRPASHRAVRWRGQRRSQRAPARASLARPAQRSSYSHSHLDRARATDLPAASATMTTRSAWRRQRSVQGERCGIGLIDDEAVLDFLFGEPFKQAVLPPSRSCACEAPPPSEIAIDDRAGQRTGPCRAAPSAAASCSPKVVAAATPERAGTRPPP